MSIKIADAEKLIKENCPDKNVKAILLNFIFYQQAVIEALPDKLQEDDLAKVIMYELSFTHEANQNLIANAEQIVNDAKVSQEKLNQLTKTLGKVMTGVEWRQGNE